MPKPADASRTTCCALRVVSGALLLAVLAAPSLATHNSPACAAALYFSFSPVCHQNPSRSFHLWGAPLAVCHRCCGIYGGLFLAMLFPMRALSSPRIGRGRRIWVLGALLFLVFDAALPLTGIWESTPGSRFLSGFVFGAMLSTLLIPGISEFLAGVRLRRPGTLSSSLHGVLL